jgi:hypothetical protein
MKVRKQWRAIISEAKVHERRRRRGRRRKYFHNFKNIAPNSLDLPMSPLPPDQ